VVEAKRVDVSLRQLISVHEEAQLLRTCSNTARFIQLLLHAQCTLNLERTKMEFIFRAMTDMHALVAITSLASPTTSEA